MMMIYGGTYLLGLSLPVILLWLYRTISKIRYAWITYHLIFYSSFCNMWFSTDWMILKGGRGTKKDQLITDQGAFKNYVILFWPPIDPPSPPKDYAILTTD